MTDLLRVLPTFPIGQFARLIPSLEKNGISTSDLLTLEAADIGKRTHLPLLDVKRLCTAVLDALHADLGIPNSALMPPPRQARQPESGTEARPEDGDRPAPEKRDEQQAFARALRNTAASLSAQWQTISTLDPELDRALAGGIPAGYITEITGESGAGKTQFLLTLLLSVQLPPPHGLGRPALYISTEAPLSTRRLAQMLSANPLFQRLPPSERPSLDNIISTATPDLESQDHILTFQVPVEIERRGIGLLVLDSVAANYRAEFERSASAGQGSNMGARSAELVKLGMHLRDLAQRHNLAVVVSNQVADRFTGSGGSSSGFANFKTPASSLPYQRHTHTPGFRSTQESPLATRSRGPLPNLPSDPPSSIPSRTVEEQPPPSPPLPPPPPAYQPPPDNLPTHDQHQPTHPVLLLDHQQRWFTGWGDSPFAFRFSSSSSSSSSSSYYSSPQPLKTPSLGLVWSTQISTRIALFRQPRHAHARSHYRPLDLGDDGASLGGVRSLAAGGGWRRFMKVVFAAHAAETGPGLEQAREFEVWMGGLRSVGKERRGREGGEGG
ncbi:hypothetical protein VTI74DRAFT_7922 [Chaetomium olivicolor]